VVRYHHGRLYVINRLGQDNVLVLDPDNLRTPLLQFSTGNGTNPQDIEIVALNKAYISRYDSAELLVVDPQTGTERGTVDLSAFADADGLPEMSAMAQVGTRVYVACQRLDRNGGFAPVGDSYLAVIDSGTDALVDMDRGADGVQGIRLAAANPYSVVAVGRRIIVSELAGFGDLEGGIEVIDEETGISRGLVITEAQLGGDVTTLDMVDQEKGYAIVSDANFANFVKPVDLKLFIVGAALEGHSHGFTPDLAIDGNRLIVADRGAFDNPGAAGLLIYDAATGVLSAGPISTGLPPSSIAVLAAVETSTAVQEEAGTLPHQTSLGNAYPNPFNGGTQIPFVVASSEVRVTLVLYDALGRKIRTLVNGFLPLGTHAVTWDGLDEAGAVVGNGFYLVELRAGTARTTGKLMLLK
ncbi:MAG: T9SS type A sorting domain-containing protein, partial [Candidatus Latescibacteria bacterium]|nr:T9SS type A sorting domain-containing protein [Candidatus Latescibacterota bacterium]